MIGTQLFQGTDIHLCYEKVGFKHEGRMRAALNRDGRRWDLIYMGILRAEWEERDLVTGFRQTLP
jgi:hypothetical protein